MPPSDRESVRARAREWFARIAREPRDARFRLDYGIFLDRPERAAALADEAIRIRDVLSADRAPRRILDAGCGFGIHAALLSVAAGCEVTGIDPAGSKIEASRRLARLLPEARVSFLRAVAQDLPLADGRFDAVLVRESLSHVPEAGAALAEFARVLAPGGSLHVRDYNNRWGIPARAARRRAWRIAERGPAEGPADPPEPYERIRTRILRERFQDAPRARIVRAARATRGQSGDGLLREGLNVMGTGRVSGTPPFFCRHPVHGGAEEKTFSPPELKRLLATAGFTYRAVPSRHFNAQAGGWRKGLADLRDALIERAGPAGLPFTPLIECAGIKRETPNPGLPTPRKPQASKSGEIPSITAVIPSRDGSRGGNVGRLAADLDGQTVRCQVEVVVGVSPCGRAHNEGARRSRGEILVFVDDDVRLGHARVVENLVRVLVDHPDVGIAGASQLAPLSANPFQRLCARRLPRSVFPVVGRIVDTDMATHAAMAIRRDLYEKVGGEPEDLLRADDQVLRARVRDAGLRVVVAPDTWVFHPPPESWRAFARARMRDGIAAAHDRRKRPDLLFDAPEGAGVVRTVRRPFLWRAARAAGRFSADLLTGNVLSLASRLLHGAGYAAGTLGWGRPSVREGATRSVRPRRPRLLCVEYTAARFQAVDRGLLGRTFDVRTLDFRDAATRGWRWWTDLWRELVRARGALVWFADRHAAATGFLGRLLGRPVAVVVGGYEVARIPEIGYGLPLSWRGRLVSRAACLLPRVVVANSDFMRGEIRRVHRLGSHRVVRMHHGIGQVEGPVAWPREPVVLTVGEVSRVNLRLKGLLDFREAARLAPSLRWIVAGPGEKEAVETLLAGAPPNLEYAGELDGKALTVLYGKARFYLQLSRVEGFGMALAEAMSAGCVPVTTGAGAMPEVTGGLGRTVPFGDPGAVARLVAAWTPDRAEHEAAARWIREAFPLSVRAAAIGALFRS